MTGSAVALDDRLDLSPPRDRDCRGLTEELELFIALSKTRTPIYKEEHREERSLISNRSFEGRHSLFHPLETKARSR